MGERGRVEDISISKKLPKDLTTLPKPRFAPRFESRTALGRFYNNERLYGWIGRGMIDWREGELFERKDECGNS